MSSPDTPLEQSAFGCCLLNALNTIRGLDLPYIASQELRKTPWDASLSTPYQIVSPAPERINADSGTNEGDDIEYGVIISTVAANNWDITPATLGWLLFCRERTRKAFMNKRTFNDPVLPDGYFVVRTTVQPGQPQIDSALQNNYDASYLAVYFQVREPRT